MKKLIIYLSLILALFALLYFINQQSQKEQNEAYTEEAQQLYGTTPDNLDTETRNQLQNPDYQNIILPADFEAKLSNGESGFVYFFSPRCPTCVITTPQLNEIAEQYNVSLLQYNVLEFPEAWTQYNLEATPTLNYFHDGQLVPERMTGGFFGNDPEQDALVEETFHSYFQAFTN